MRFFGVFLTRRKNRKIEKSQYSRVPNTTVGNPCSFFGACPSYMALFGTTRLLNFKKSSFLHFYSELLAYWFFSLHHFTSKSFCIKYDLTVYWWVFDSLHWNIFIFASSQWKQAARSYEVSFISAIWMVSFKSWIRLRPNQYAHDCTM